jgi:NAD(P)-dependent dehydrogenase (short-subunit alcohol dehydrogenase family)
MDMSEGIGRVALVTGGARGIGRATALRLAEDGVDVAVLDIAQQIPGYPQSLGTAAELEDTAEQVRKVGRRAIAIQADVRDTAAVDAAVARTVDELGGVHILIANAGLAVHAPFVEQDDPNWDLVLGTNLLGAVRLLRAGLPHLVRQRYGRIVTVSSVGGRQGVPGVAPYAASKWALIGVTKTVALEHAGDGITANVVAPTTVETPLYRHDEQYRDMMPQLYEQNLSFEERERRVGEWVAGSFNAIPVPWIDPEDVADAIAFLTSDRARYVTGEVLDLAAGANARNSA